MPCSSIRQRQKELWGGREGQRGGERGREMGRGRKETSGRVQPRCPPTDDLEIGQDDCRRDRAGGAGGLLKITTPKTQ